MDAHARRKSKLMTVLSIPGAHTCGMGHEVTKPTLLPAESQSKLGTKMVNPEPCKELEMRPQLFMAGIVPY